MGEVTSGTACRRYSVTVKRNPPGLHAAAHNPRVGGVVFTLTNVTTIREEDLEANAFQEILSSELLDCVEVI
jgi:hypothetical protein